MKQCINLVKVIQAGMSHVTMWVNVNVNQLTNVLCYLRVAKEYILFQRHILFTNLVKCLSSLNATV